MKKTSHVQHLPFGPECERYYLTDDSKNKCLDNAFSDIVLCFLSMVTKRVLNYIFQNDQPCSLGVAGWTTWI